ncbi:MAG: hypothetical protein UW24_C0020G0036 [Parcubacteria group bacterium GW2011_GWA2_44_12]|nr:MAG: hypothetical protein UW24_C0020G0036 [Parcubacteria group bacterium GW2011_GWA2_44_12]
MGEQHPRMGASILYQTALIPKSLSKGISDCNISATPPPLRVELTKTTLDPFNFLAKSKIWQYNSSEIRFL